MARLSLTRGSGLLRALLLVAIASVVGQLVANVAGWADADVWDAEDDALLAAARSHLAVLAGRDSEAGAPHPTAAGERA